MKTDFIFATCRQALNSCEGSCLLRMIKKSRILRLAGVAVAALLMQGCVGTYYGDGYDSNYYNNSAPFIGGIFPFFGGGWGGNTYVYSGEHHFYGNGFGHRGGSYGGYHGGGYGGHGYGGYH